MSSLATSQQLTKILINHKVTKDDEMLLDICELNCGLNLHSEFFRHQKEDNAPLIMKVKEECVIW